MEMHLEGMYRCFVLFFAIYAKIVRVFFLPQAPRVRQKHCKTSNTPIRPSSKNTAIRSKNSPRSNPHSRARNPP
jgi:hypothetical protein